MHAIDHGYGIEMDLQLSADCQAIVFHDYHMSRLTGKSGPIQQVSYSDLAETQLSGSIDAIKNLPEILSLVDGKVPLLIELKDQDGAMGPNIGALEDATAAALVDYEGDVALMSFNPHSAERMKELCPDRPIGLVTCSYDPEVWSFSAERFGELREIPDFERIGAQFISHEASDLARDRVKELKESGAPILCWTIRSEEEASEALKTADNITFEGYLPA